MRTTITRGIVAAAFTVLGIAAPAGADSSTTTTTVAAPGETSTTVVDTTTTTTTTTTTVAPTATATTAPATVASTTSTPRTTGAPASHQPARPAKPVKPTRGTAVQVTPTLPPPIPPEEVLPENSGSGRRVVYSNSRMRVWAVDETGKVVKTHRVSGKRYIPSPGTYSVFSRSLYTYSRTSPDIKWMYMVRFAHSPSGDNIGFHEIPQRCGAYGCYRLQTEAQLGQALSGGCVRQSTPDAIWMWNWAGLGTKVVVLP